MVEDRASLGPLELADGRWGIGDSARPGTHWLELCPDGFHQHAPDAERQLVPWARVMTGIRLTWGKHARNTAGRGKYTLKGMVADRDGGWLHMPLRDPYEDQHLGFDQHTRPYRAVDVLRLEALLRRLTDEGRPHLLGDPEWLGRAVAALAGGKNRWVTDGSLEQAVTEALEAAGGGRL
ncbi:hypothetical protein [Streptomyces sp. SID9727]|uniref:hypothetical protein n=1 Tax=Streptomyces sp. SID9727 TaxID=2706114 RepID=UPI0013C55F95|nr:hypothetical protein [Streptomyces sp. SID9727]NEC66142.1 hypothetical protein [Streptomyces sp. SID9727]